MIRTISKALIALNLLVIAFHSLILVKIIPYDITWGGRLKTDEEMYVFETISILINLFMIFILALNAGFIKSVFPRKVLVGCLWFFFVLFIANTVGNLFATTLIEKCFSIVTLLSAVGFGVLIFRKDRQRV